MPSVPKPFSHLPMSDWISRFQQSKSADERLEALQAIGSLGRALEISPHASTALHDMDSTVRALAAKLLRNSAIDISGDAEKQLVSLLDDDDPDVRFESARALARRKANLQDRILHVLTAFLDEPETHALMIASVLNTIVELDLMTAVADDQIRPRLLRLLEHERAEVREAVSVTFARWPEISKSCIEQLLPLLDDSEPIVREKIAFTIGHTGIFNVAVETALKAASEDDDAEVARESREALIRLQQK